MNNHDEIDPDAALDGISPSTLSLDLLEQYWTICGKRATAALRDAAIEEAAGKMLPRESVEAVLRDLASATNGILSGVAERCRALGVTDEVILAVQEVITDAQLQISVALDGAAEAAATAIEKTAGDLGPLDLDGVDDLRGPSDRKTRAHKGKPHAGNAKAKKPRA